MGYLTNITFRNDAFDVFESHPEQTIKMIADAMHGHPTTDENRDYVPIGNHCNPVIIQKPRHADDHTLYLHAGNTVEDLWDCHDALLDVAISELKFHLKRLTEQKKSRTK